jgi:hypothetical protein
MGAREPAPNLVGNRGLVRGVTEREEETDRNGFGVDLRQRGEIERFDDAVRPNSLADAEAAFDGNQRRRVVGAEPVKVRAVLTPQVEDVLEPGRRDEGGAGSFSLQKRVRGDRGPVRESLEVAGA